MSVSSRPPTTTFAASSARRNKAALMTVAIVVLALLMGIVVSTWQAVRATKAEDLAQERLDAEKRAREETDEARKEAIANLKKAREAVDQMLTRVGQERLQD